eukprot:CAMPEP_0119555038 /NCGR_PEP_ID=MMETSP1352-20130426/7368_1 /TAXON_ID=265584 /ORGANISM="Stauroneis constricta, Strain CCMP1120" /LENGTH=301 /DNA_ID=CAMNT_0007601733 /DNA_START=137 /DNA_END=1039 /DNA_ORIENTATION=+
MSTSGAEGLQLYRGTTAHWKIGRVIGSGACGAVHELESLRSSSDFSSEDLVAKMVPLPKKTSKYKRSPAETNAALLYYEHTVYQNFFQGLQGTYIPRLPSGKEVQPYGDISGYRYLVMERMEMQLHDVVPELLRESKSGKVSFGPVAAQLLKCVQSIHENRHIVVDIKPDNFMLAPAVPSPGFPTQKRAGRTKGKTASAAAGSKAQQLAGRIRILDLALVQPIASVSKSHRPNEDKSSIAGTPLYSSINVHQGQTPSRRDDIEALAYVIAEMLMQLSAGGDASIKLPWSNAKSDEEIGSMK